MSNKHRDIGQLSKDEFQKFANRRHSKTRKARIGFIGAGWWATTNHMPLLKARRDVELVSVCGLDENVLKRCQHDFGFPHVTPDYHELLKQDLDGVVVASPHVFHAEHALAAGPRCRAPSPSRPNPLYLHHPRGRGPRGDL